jgi:CRISPR-associated endonuclease/helicase Cas3
VRGPKPWTCKSVTEENQQGDKHCLKDHLISVANLSEKFANGFYKRQFKSLAWLIGILHDIGKIDNLFQEYLKNIGEKQSLIQIPHSPIGAYFTYHLFSRLKMNMDLALVVASHHSGLYEPGELLLRLSNNTYSQCIISKMINFTEPIIKEKQLSILKIPELTALQREMLVRMLFSALIDADRLDTEAHFNPERSKIRENKISIKAMASKLKINQDELIAKNKQNPSLVNEIRDTVYKSCLAAAAGKPGLYRLTVPTGGGKTRSALAFALEHALINGHDRVIFALPYTSIIDQTASVYREILGNDAVLEHHSQIMYKHAEDESEMSLKFRLAEENWDVPLIVTTTVQLLESLFSNRPSRCRKIHRLAKSIIVFDEAQALPQELLKPTLQVIRDLMENYGATVVLSTATQPALKSSYLPEMSGFTIREIVDDYSKYFNALKRVRYERIANPISIEDLACEISRHKQVLVIMNTRKKAIQLVDALNGIGCLHLSTLLCGAHRKEVLLKAKALLNTGKPIKLISTQVVEAGVDLDFPIVYRAIGPLDRIVQAAGRCNREGRMSEQLGTVVIFELEDERTPTGPYKAGIEQARLILAEHDSPEILNDPAIFEDYFERLYNSIGNNLDSYRIQEKRAVLDYKETSDLYRLIKEDTVPVIVRYGEYKKALDKWSNYKDREAWRHLQPYIVNIYKREVATFFGDGFLSDISDGLYLWEGVYDELKGISAIQRDPSDLIV